MFGIGDKVLAMIGGGLSAVLAIALAYVLISKNAEISSLDKAINAPVTGWSARLSAATADLATARGNAAALGSQIDRQNEAIEALQSKADAAYAQGAAARSSALDKVAAANATVAKLANAKAGADACASADQLILETVK